jgi:Ca-activated chloride channel family protein
MEEVSLNTSALTALSQSIGWSQKHNMALIAVILVLIPLFFATSRLRKKFLETWARPKTKSLNHELATPIRKYKVILYFAGLLLVWVASLGPQWGQKETQVSSMGLDLCIALDLSQSMLTEDVSPSRLKMAKNQLSIFLPRLGGDRVALVGFAGSSFIASPLTPDKNAVIGFLEPLDSSFISNPTTRLEAGVEGCLKAFGLDKLKQSDEFLENQTTRVIALISDGEDSRKASTALERAKDLEIPILTLGIGTEKGSTIPVRSERGELSSYVRDPRTQKPVISRLQKMGLEHLSASTGGKYFNLNDGLATWDSFETELSRFNRESQFSESLKAREERFQWPLLLAFILLLIELVLPELGFSFFKSNKLPLIFLVSIQLVSSQRVTFAWDAWPSETFLNRKAYRSFLESELRESHRFLNDALIENPTHLTTRTNRISLDLLDALQTKDEDIRKQGILQVLKLCTETKRSLQKQLAKHDQIGKVFHYQCGLVAEFAKDIPLALAFQYNNLHVPLVLKEIETKSREAIERLLIQQNQNQNKSNGEGDSEQKSNDSKGEGDSKSGKSGNSDYSQGKPSKPQFSGTDVSESEAKKILESVAGEEQEVKKRKAQAEARSSTQSSRNKDGGVSKDSGNPW